MAASKMAASAPRAAFRMIQLSDIHFMTKPKLSQMFGKRIIGTTNLELFGRGKRFDLNVQRKIIEQIDALKPDLVVVAGDVTSQSLPAEFELARDTMAPLLNKYPSIVIPGNHDVYTRRAQRDHLMEQYFGKWMHLPESGLDAAPSVFTAGPVSVIGISACRPTVFLSTGKYPTAQLNALYSLLRSQQLAGQCVVLASHYPVVDRFGSEYNDGMHAAENNEEVLDLLAQAWERKDSVMPAMLVHGHIHKGYLARLEYVRRSGSGPMDSPGLGRRISGVPVSVAGAAGYRFDPVAKRTSAFNVFDISPKLPGSGLAVAPDSEPWHDVSQLKGPYHIKLTRYVLNGEEYQAESKPYASGY